MKILIAPNYFKGSLSATNAANIIADAIKTINKDIVTVKCPLADGGDGTIHAIHSVKDGKIINTQVNDPLNRKIHSSWLLLENNSTAIIESAKANGLSLLNPSEYNPFITSTYGVGEFILDAVKYDCRRIIIGVGGSSTNDAGYGALKALGVRFLDKSNKEIEDNVLDFSNLAGIDTAGLHPKLKETEILIATDVRNPLTGENGASYTYAKQKGANEQDLEILDSLLTYFADVCSREFNKDLRDKPGAGAAGGLSYGLAEVLEAKIVDGFDTVASLINLEATVRDSDIIITGEGRLDSQTLWGKTPFRVAQLAKQYNKPCIAIAGLIEDNFNTDYFDKIYVLKRDNMSIQESMANAGELLRDIIVTNISSILKNY